MGPHSHSDFKMTVITPCTGDGAEHTWSASELANFMEGRRQNTSHSLRLVEEIGVGLALAQI